MYIKKTDNIKNYQSIIQTHYQKSKNVEETVSKFIQDISGKEYSKRMKQQ
jgi:hypothetical protein